MATEMAWNRLATYLGHITPPHMIANITGLKNRQVFPLRCVNTGCAKSPSAATAKYLTAFTFSWI